MPPLDGVLLQGDIEALEDAIDEGKIAQRGWTVSKYGAVKDEIKKSDLYKYMKYINKSLNRLTLI
ncbi:hypothetical protein CF386_10190 [Paraphotobacterium marinum]|uniref:Uncharacterized protein n=1 Tax=Paraphotobacterium marinum TaxID=1755811 RepID=A0A220VGN9_9GAMM|nr:hypothetical protein [Paraphotobacterium marinum]ASK79420.1 hypothetical protein CF386_10190 [Paraphotobacterium marinum]